MLGSAVECPVHEAVWASSSFLLDVLKLVIPYLMCTPRVVGCEWSQLGKLASFILIFCCPALSAIG
jgi:hypothetical protein